jgi:transcriptional regulator with XRE-family HTH domain
MDGPTISRLRRRLGITQTVSRWERGSERPRPAVLRTLREVLTGGPGWHPYHQARARIQADAVAAYLFDDGLTLTAISRQAIAQFRRRYQVGASQWMGRDFAAHLLDLGASAEDAEVALDELQSGAQAGVRVVVPFRSRPLALYMEPVVSEGSLLGLVAFLVSPEQEQPLQMMGAIEVVTANGEILPVNRAVELGTA